MVPVKQVEINGRPSVGWWRVDPNTGDALAMTEDGGSTATEYSLLVRLSVAAAVGMWTFIGCGGAAPGAYSRGGVAGAGPPVHGRLSGNRRAPATDLYEVRS